MARTGISVHLHLPLALALALATSATPGLAQPLVEAARGGRLDRVQAILAWDPQSVHVTDPSGYTALRWAGIRGHRDILLLLARSGADPNTVGADGGTPLHGAAHHDDPEMMEALLDEGGDITIRNRWGRTPLHVAARRGCLRVARLLLDAGADPDATTHEGWSSLNVAYRGGHPALVSLLLSRGADPNLADTAGVLPGIVRLSRPPSVPLSRRQMDELVGHYDLGGGFGFHVWREGDRLRLMEFAPDDLLPVGADTFYTRQEPWRAVFLRGGDGGVARLQVDFLRRSVVAERVRNPTGGTPYLGSRSCMGCHASGRGGGPAAHWMASRHSQAFHTLSTDRAKALARARDESRGVTDSARDPQCLMCHVTGGQNALATFAEGFGIDEGVGCEACHGPGGAYAEPGVMSDRDAFLAKGGVVPGELTCRACHRDASFNFLEALERIRHWDQED